MPRDRNEASRCHTLLEGWRKRHHSGRSVILKELRMSNWNRIGLRGTTAAQLSGRSWPTWTPVGGSGCPKAIQLRSRGCSAEEPFTLLSCELGAGAGSYSVASQIVGVCSWVACTGLPPWKWMRLATHLRSRSRFWLPKPIKYQNTSAAFEAASKSPLLVSR